MADDKRSLFNYDEYILGINFEFVSLGGSQAVYLGYLSDTPEEEKVLYETLSKINGVLLTGGGLTLIDPSTRA